VLALIVRLTYEKDELRWAIAEYLQAFGTRRQGVALKKLRRSLHRTYKR
jgi:hypothetical protein